MRKVRNMIVALLFILLFTSCSESAEIETLPNIDELPRAVSAELQLVGEDIPVTDLEFGPFLDAVNRAETVSGADLTEAVFALVTVEYSDKTEEPYSLYIGMNSSEAFILNEEILFKLPDEYYETLLTNEGLETLYILRNVDIDAEFMSVPIPTTGYSVKTRTGNTVNNQFTVNEAPAMYVESLSDFTPKFSASPKNYSTTLIDREGAVAHEALPGEYLCEIEAEFEGDGWSGTMFFKVALNILGTPRLELSAVSAAQGEVITARILNAGPGTVFNIYLPHIDKTVPMFDLGMERLAFLQLNITAPVGEHNLELRRVNVGGSNETVTSETYTVVSTEFTRQDLKTSSETQSVYTNENLAGDNRKVETAYSVSKPEPLWDGIFIRPVEGGITTEFGQLRYVNGNLQSRHSGIDIAAAEGVEVMAPAAGTVVFAEELTVNGNTVIVDHGLNVFSSYSHLSSINVKQGDTVKQSDILGLVGSTGYSTGPHLHYTIKINGYYVNPFFMESVDILNNETAR